MVRSASSATVFDVVAAAGFHRRGAPCADRSGHHDDHVEEIECAALEVLAGDVFKRLPARPQVHAIADLGVACHCADLRVGEVADQFGDGVVRDDSIGIDADVDLFVDRSKAQSSAPRPCRHWAWSARCRRPDADIGRVGVARNLVGVVLRTVIDDDDRGCSYSSTSSRSESCARSPSPRCMRESARRRGARSPAMA